MEMFQTTYITSIMVSTSNWATYVFLKQYIWFVSHIENLHTNSLVSIMHSYNTVRKPHNIQSNNC